MNFAFLSVAALSVGVLSAGPADRPTIYWASDPVRPGEAVVVVGDGLDAECSVQLVQLPDTPAGNQLRPVQWPQQTVLPEVLQPRGQSLKFVVAGMRPDAKTKIDEVCRAWAEDTGEPFVTLVARRGVIVTREAFGRDPGGQAINRDYRCWVASITKTVTALLFSQFVDQNLLGLDDSLSVAFPDYPKNDPHVPTFRQCFNHTSGSHWNSASLPSGSPTAAATASPSSSLLKRSTSSCPSPYACPIAVSSRMRGSACIGSGI